MRFFQTLTTSIASTLLFVAQQSLAACEYGINNHWDSGFQANIKLTRVALMCPSGGATVLEAVNRRRFGFTVLY